MWYLMEEQPDGTPSARYWLGGVSGPGRSIGRKHVDIQLRASSVSRTHARLTVIKGPFYNHPHPVRNTTAVTVFDSSAYGTFLKYPDGHAVHRSLPTHHTRLDKHTPTEISDGARLAFGAPTAWWKLVRHPMLVVQSRLSELEIARLNDVSAATALDVLASWTPHATHLVTNVFVPTSFKHLLALTTDKQIVTPAFVEAVNHVVVNACSVATSSQTASAAEEATRMPDPKLFKPPVNKAEPQLAAYATYIPEDPLDCILSDTRRKLFLSTTIAFERDERRAKYAHIVEACGGETALLSALDKASDRRVFQVVATPREAGHVPEAALNAAIISASLTPLEQPVSLPERSVHDATAGEARSSSPSPTRHGRKRPAPPSPDGTVADADETAVKADHAAEQEAAQSPSPPVRKRSRLVAPASLSKSVLHARPPKPVALDADNDDDDIDDDDEAGEPDEGAVGDSADSGRSAGRAGSAGADAGGSGTGGGSGSGNGEGVPEAAQAASDGVSRGVHDTPRYHEDDVVIMPQVRMMEAPANRRTARDPRDVRPFRTSAIQRQPAIQVYRYTGVEADEEE